MTTTREALIDAAADLLDEGGVAAVTLREVGRRAGVSHNAPYKHFADKVDLLAAVVARDLRRQYLAGRRKRAGRPAIDIITTILHGYIRHALAHPELFKLTYGPWSTGSAELAEAANESRSSFVELVTAAQDDGDLPPAEPQRAASLLLALAHGAADLALSGHLARDGKGNADPADLVDDLLRHLRPGTSSLGRRRGG